MEEPNIPSNESHHPELPPPALEPEPVANPNPPHPIETLQVAPAGQTPWGKLIFSFLVGFLVATILFQFLKRKPKSTDFEEAQVVRTGHKPPHPIQKQNAITTPASPSVTKPAKATQRTSRKKKSSRRGKTKPWLSK